jgi:hypothetical protein
MGGMPAPGPKVSKAAARMTSSTGGKKKEQEKYSTSFTSIALVLAHWLQYEWQNMANH